MTVHRGPVTIQFVTCNLVLVLPADPGVELRVGVDGGPPVLHVVGPGHVGIVVGPPLHLLGLAGLGNGLSGLAVLFGSGRGCGVVVSLASTGGLLNS